MYIGVPQGAQTSQEEWVTRMRESVESSNLEFISSTVIPERDMCFRSLIAPFVGFESSFNVPDEVNKHPGITPARDLRVVDPPACCCR